MLSQTKQAETGFVIAGIVLLAIALIFAGSWATVALAQLDLSVFQKEGASEEQQSKDRYDCHRLAIQRTEFDPGVAPRPAVRASQSLPRPTSTGPTARP